MGNTFRGCRFLAGEQEPPIHSTIVLPTNSLVSRVFQYKIAHQAYEFPTARSRPFLTFFCPGALPSVNQDHARRRRTRQRAAASPPPLNATPLATAPLALVRSNDGQLQTAQACEQSD
jgi:hypothetical protein